MPATVFTMKATTDGGFASPCDGHDGWTPPPTTTPATCIPDNETTTHVDEMLDVARTFYVHLYRKRHVHAGSRRRLLRAAKRIRRFDPSAADAAGALVTTAEVIAAIYKLQTGKAPGPDGIPNEFYRHFAVELGPILRDVINAAYHAGSLSTLQGQGDICLLFKKGDRADLKNWRPITKCNRLATIADMIMVHRLSPMLSKSIAGSQTAFLSDDGRRMHENIVKAQGALHHAAGRARKATGADNANGATDSDAHIVRVSAATGDSAG